MPQDKGRIDAIEAFPLPSFAVRFLIFLLLCLLAGPLAAQSSKSTSKEKAKLKPSPAAPAKRGVPAKPGKPTVPTKPGSSAKPTVPAKPVPAKPAPAKPAAAAIPTALPAPKVEWKPIYYKGRAYVPANQVASYYDLLVPALWQKSFALQTADKKFTIDMTVSEKRLKLSGWTFYFSFPVVQPGAVPMISVFDVRNILDPILRPNDRRDPVILRTVVIDPAGGGKDPGIKSPFIAEKDLTLAVATLLVPQLKEKGYRVVLTRDGDKTVLPKARVLAANDVPDEAIYLHLRAASGGSDVRGFECSTFPPAGTPATAESDSPNIDKRFFAGNINDRESLALATTVQNSVVRNAVTLDLGIKRVRVDELRDIRMPAISCKLGYLSHKQEAKKLATPEYQAQLAAALVLGVDRYAAFLRTGYEERIKEDGNRPLSFGPAIVRQDPVVIPPGAEKIALKVPIVSQAGVSSNGSIIDRSKMELQVFLFEKVNDAEIDLSTANPPDVNWLSVLPDWQAGVPEWLQITYLRPAFSPPETKAYGKRIYYGYVARLIYDGRLLDETSSPANLNRALYYFTPVFPRR